jgi:hypothetical protein
MAYAWTQSSSGGVRNLFNTADRDDLLRRLSSLQTSSPRQWGKMDVAQMLAHCAVTMEVACGDSIKKQSFIGRVLAPFVRKSALGEKPFQRNGPTDPAFKIAGGREFAAERARLTALVDKFCSRGPAAAEGLVHSFFGRLTADEWARLMYKHIDHHLRQFSS